MTIAVLSNEELLNNEEFRAEVAEIRQRSRAAIREMLRGAPRSSTRPEEEDSDREATDSRGSTEDPKEDTGFVTTQGEGSEAGAVDQRESSEEPPLGQTHLHSSHLDDDHVDLDHGTPSDDEEEVTERATWITFA
jgi:hypothetical protein